MDIKRILDIKRCIFFITIVLPCCLIFIGCHSNFATDNIFRGGNTLTLSISNSRTSMGDKSGSTYPIYWSEGDKIVANGVVSGEAQIDADEPSKATFKFDSEIAYPCNITYPYCPATSAEQPIVELSAEQSYTEDLLLSSSAPMCGYATSSGNVATKHLYAVMRIPVKSVSEGVTLNRIVISSPNKIAGEFAVDCRNAQIVATENTTNSITYTANTALSMTEEKVFYISIPAIDAATCTVELFDSDSSKMVARWSANAIKAGKVYEFKTLTYKVGTTCGLAPLYNYDDELIYDRTIRGYVKDNLGNPIANVAVTDGFTIVTTDSKGYYSMKVSSDCWFVYISLPSEYEVPINEYGQPGFYQRYHKSVRQYDFTLTPLAEGKEKEFALFVLGDPQVSSQESLDRFNKESVTSIKRHCDELASKGISSYGICLGDIIANSGKRNCEWLRDDMRDGFSIDHTGIPVFQVMGNHDYTYCNTSNPLLLDDDTSTINLKAQRNHEEIFGPVDYSFNRGDVHIIGMKDMIYTSATTGTFTTGFTEEQYRWLKQDLALVPKDKAVVLCVHVPLFAQSDRYIREVQALLNQFNDVHIISGHLHIIQNYEHEKNGLSTTKIFEHNAIALCGAWWSANIGGDGTPNGFEVFIGGNDSSGGGKFVDWYYIGCNEGMNTRSHQMRLYRGDAVTGAAIPEGDDNTYGIKGYYGFNYDENVLLANVYNADSKWVIKVYEDDVYSGDMEKIPYLRPKLTDLIGGYTFDNPRRAANGVESSHDMYVAGLQLGILDRYKGGSTPGGGMWAPCYHMYKYTLKNKNADIKVVAIDRFGNEYTETKITEGTDYSLTKINSTL